MTKFKSVRNGQIAELASENEQPVTIRLEESREERNISPATLEFQKNRKTKKTK
jgi:hypothetical protein